MNQIFTRWLDNRRRSMPRNGSAHEFTDFARTRRVETGLPGYASDRSGRSEVALTAVVLVAAVVGLSWLSFEINTGGMRVHGARTRVVNEIVRSEVTQILVPPALVRLAKDVDKLGPLQSHEDVKACLRAHGLEHVWYAMQFRSFESSGKVSTSIMYCRPFDNSLRALEFRAVLARIEKRPRENQLDALSQATLRILPESAANADPDLDLPELIGPEPDR